MGNVTCFYDIIRLFLLVDERWGHSRLVKTRELFPPPCHIDICLILEGFLDTKTMAFLQVDDMT